MRNQIKKGFAGIIIAVIIAAVIIGAVVYKISLTDNKTNNVDTLNQPATVVAEPEKIDLKIVEYSGVERKNVLELLQQNAKVEYTPNDNGAFITSVNGIKNSDTEFWLYSVNGVDATVAADKYITKSGDRIKWEYKVTE